jgi:hypothetical protein
VLADTIRAEEASSFVHYEFSVIETVKGRSAPNIKLTFGRPDWTTGVAN